MRIYVFIPREIIMVGLGTKTFSVFFFKSNNNTFLELTFVLTYDFISRHQGSVDAILARIRGLIRNTQQVMQAQSDGL